MRLQRDCRLQIANCKLHIGRGIILAGASLSRCVNLQSAICILQLVGHGFGGI